MIDYSKIVQAAQRASRKNVNVQYKEYRAKKVLFVYIFESYGNSPNKVRLLYNFSGGGVPLALFWGEQEADSPFHLPIPASYKEALDLLKTIQAASK